MVRFLPNAKKFIQQNIRKTYQEFKNKSRGLISVHVNSLYLDQDVIKSDVLYDFLGNGIKKFNPLNVGNIKSFYRICFRSVFQYYFRKRRNLEDQECIENNFSNVENWLKIVSKENPDKALNFIIRLSEFVVPKLQSTTLSNSIDFESLTDVELKSLIERIKNI